TFYDAAVSGADPVTDRPGFAEMPERLMSNGARTIIVESPDRFARDLMVQLAGHDMLKAKGISLIAASAPTFFVEDTPTAVLVRQVLGAVAANSEAIRPFPGRPAPSGLPLRCDSRHSNHGQFVRIYEDRS